MSHLPQLPVSFVSTVTVDDGIKVFYRESYPAGADPATAPVLLLLHGFPASSFQFRNLIPILATKYRVIAPDFPGYGFTVVPDERKYVYNFKNLADTVEAFIDALNIKKFAIYIFDYGGPTGLRIALRRPQDVTAIISQNGNAYVEGFGEKFWADIRLTWDDPSPKNLAPLGRLVTYETTKWQYTNGAPKPETVAPETYNLDYYLMTRPGNANIQVAYITDYGSNVPLYPQFHEYFTKYQPPVLAIWGKHDEIFVAPGAEAFKRHLPKATVKLLDAGHFPLETHLNEIGSDILEFLKANNI